MKANLDEILASIKTKSEASTVIDGLWLSRSIIGLQLEDKVQPIFGFSGEFDKKKSEDSSIYELIEHFIFSPSAHTKGSLNKTVNFISLKDLKLSEENNTIKNYLVGAVGYNGYFYGNGCGISYDLNKAILHSKRELYERHLCCEIWYKRSRSLLKIKDYQIKIVSPHINIDLYTTYTNSTDTFALAVLECSNTGFFVFGAAVRSDRYDAYAHAIGEAVMFFEDAKKERNGISSTEQSREKVMSLRDRNISKIRKD